MISIHVSGLQSLIADFNEVQSMGWYTNTLEKLAPIIKRAVQDYAPRDRGTMEESVQVIIDDEGMEVVVPVPWAVFNEYGTRYMPVGDEEQPLKVRSRSGKLAFRPFIRPALLKVIREHEEDFLDEIMSIFSHG